MYPSNHFKNCSPNALCPRCCQRVLWRRSRPGRISSAKAGRASAESSITLRLVGPVGPGAFSSPALLSPHK
ncbi:hypothetical protein HMPREF0262_02180 [Clostridium sp. ATCC 29733]|nr:hypothetical protein HMPREF0262_02180 [Clostridium sp. ATCC 29733]